MQKMKIDLCPLPYEKVSPFGLNNVGISKNGNTRERLHYLAQGKTWMKFCLPVLRFLKTFLFQ